MSATYFVHPTFQNVDYVCSSGKSSHLMSRRAQKNDNSCTQPFVLSSEATKFTPKQEV